ncbi:MAG: tyrosine-type recombinase/integrase [Clostridia bacterium]
MAAFLDDLADRGRSPATLATYRAGCTFWRRELSAWDPKLLADPESVVTLSTLRSILRTPAVVRLKPRSRRIRLQALDGLIRCAMRHGDWHGDKPVRKLPKLRIRRTLPQYWSIPVALDFLQRIPAVSRRPYRDVAIFRLYLSAGLRLSELLRLTRGDVDWEGHRIHVLGKGGKWRWVPLSEAAERDLLRYLDTRSDDAGPLFITPQGRPFTPSGMQKLFQRLAQRTGHAAPGISVRNLRHTALSALLHEGLDLVSIQAIAGHDMLTTTEGYLHLEPQAVIDRVRALNPWDRLPGGGNADQ